MSTFVFDCPACSVLKCTFDIFSYNSDSYKSTWSLFSVCRACNNSMVINGTIPNKLRVSLTGMNSPTEKALSTIKIFVEKYLNEEGFHVSDLFEKIVYSPVLPNTEHPPEYLPAEVESIFKEAAKCFSIGCYNAAGAMFRLCLDMTTKHLVSQNSHLNPSANDNKTIHNRLTWIFKNKIIADDLEELSRCIKDDGNDAAHDGTIGKVEASDLLDFTYELLERVYTQPERVKLAKVRRTERRASS